MSTQLLDQISTPVSKSEIDFFSVPPTQVAVQRGFVFEVAPQTTLTDDGPYEFHIPPDSHFLDFNKNHLYTQIRITNDDDTALAAPPNQNPALVGPINLIGKTFFKQVKLFLNNKLAFDSGDTYAFRAFTETDLNFGEEAKKNELAICGYEKDAPAGHIDDDQNTGWQTRRDWFVGSRVVEFMAPLHVDIFHQEKYMINKMDVKLELHRNSNAFCLMSFEQNPAYKIRVHKMSWFVRRVDLEDSTTVAIESMLLRTTIKYPLRRVVIKVVQIPDGQYNSPATPVFTGQLPRRLVVFLVDPNSFHGSYAASPFNYRHYDIQSIQVCAGGVYFPPNPLTTDFENGRVARAFTQVYEALGLAGTGKGNWLNPADFVNGGRCYFPFDLTADTGDGGHWELVRDGTTAVHITFRNATPAEGVKMVVLGEFDGLATVDRFRNIYFDK